MQVRHVKNLYWLIFAVAVTAAIVFSSNPFLLGTGIVTALFALISILVGKPALLWLFMAYIILINLPFAIPFLLLAGISSLFNKKTRPAIYKGIAPFVAVFELIIVIKALGGAGWFFIGSIAFCPFLIYEACFSEEQPESTNSTPQIK